MTTWLTSDWHLHHERIIQLTNRPFKNADEMHQQLIQRYCAVVQPEDTVWFLGDLTLRSPNSIRPVQRIVADLPGAKHFVIGNHDCCKWDSYLKMGFVSFHSSVDVWFDNQQYCLVHDPMDAPIGTGRVICGHVHNNWKARATPCPTVNIGVDCWDFYPVQLEAVLKLLASVEQR